MTFLSQLQEMAAEFARNAQSQATHLHHELLEIERRKRQIEAKFHVANLAHDRLASFVPALEGNFLCPRCWINNEVRSSLRPIGGGGTSTEDLFRCNTCELEIALRF
jgi:hypothetical protein